MTATVAHNWSVSARQQTSLLLLLLRGMMHCPIPGSVFVTPRRSCNDQQASDCPSPLAHVYRSSDYLRACAVRVDDSACADVRHPSVLVQELRVKQSITFGGPNEYLNPRQNDAYFVSSWIRSVSRRREVLMIRWLGRVVSSPRRGLVRTCGERSVYSHVSV